VALVCMASPYFFDNHALEHVGSTHPRLPMQMPDLVLLLLNPFLLIKRLLCIITCFFFIVGRSSYCVW
jgi:hypothetical protein